MRKLSIIVVGLAFLLSSAFAAEVNKLAFGETEVQEDNIVIPLRLNNTTAMAGMELPLQYSDGVILDKVSFENTRSEGFDLQVANINTEENMVLIALIPVVYGEGEDLAPGDDVIANLHFSVIDSDLEELEITAVEDLPNHSFMFVESKNSELIVTRPEFDNMKVELITGAASVPLSFALHQNYPNPFNPTTTLMYDLDAANHVTLEIFNVLGQKVKTLVDEYQDAGYQSVQWDGDDNTGASVATGVYFYRINAGDQKVETKKMMLLK